MCTCLYSHSLDRSESDQLSRPAVKDICSLDWTHGIAALTVCKTAILVLQYMSADLDQHKGAAAAHHKHAASAIHLPQLPCN